MSFTLFQPDYQPQPFDFNRKNFEKLPLSEQSQYLPNFINAYLLARISQLSYKSSVNAKHSDKSYRDAIRCTLMISGISYEDAKKTIFLNSRDIVLDIEGNYIPGTQGLIIFHDKTAIISFRGSEKKINDWSSNFKVKRVDFTHRKGKVHRGFLSAFDAVIPEEGKHKLEFDDVIERLKKCQYVWLTGHSLGGAIAIVAANFLQKKGVNISGIYTFGAPRVGNKDYRDYVNNLLKNKYWRFMHDHDVVPQIPHFKSSILYYKFV
ncbi:lipase family protein [Crocosphaera sp. Alani8]|uniref:lipase family protein n=1 Tax=Crocosphaera sp. Alani8 TaxID=3038952 RepID=UPI00313E3B73